MVFSSVLGVFEEKYEMYSELCWVFFSLCGRVLLLMGIWEVIKVR